jgi:hypothetical protein
MIDGRFHFADDKNDGLGLGRFINASKRGENKANLKWGAWNENKQAFAIRTMYKGRQIAKKAVRKGQEFFISYGSGYWRWVEKQKALKEIERTHK